MGFGIDSDPKLTTIAPTPATSTGQTPVAQPSPAALLPADHGDAMARGDAVRAARQLVQPTASSGTQPTPPAPGRASLTTQTEALRVEPPRGPASPRPAGLPMQTAQALFGFPSGMKVAAVVPRHGGLTVETLGSHHQSIRVTGHAPLTGYLDCVARDRVRLEALYDLGFDHLFVEIDNGAQSFELDIARAIGRPARPEPSETFGSGFLQVVGNQMAYRFGKMPPERRAQYEEQAGRGFRFAVSGPSANRIYLEMANTEVGLGKGYGDRLAADRTVFTELRHYGFDQFLLEDFNSSVVYTLSK